MSEWSTVDAAQSFMTALRSTSDTALTAHNVRRDFRKILDDADLPGEDRSPREMRHSFVSLLSDSGVPIEDISRLVGHRNTVVTETVHREQIHLVLMRGAEKRDSLFAA
ncbi:tyrosine-type recombinase/integrase [Sphaerimonospora sp. CA-214678]|uniref:tyrosine-type recombinase/integrase n=1 Tax=Sphaerimonospora sp. CA-214678 TaxID=3240029 RepID=UPI003D94ECFC